MKSNHYFGINCGYHDSSFAFLKIQDRKINEVEIYLSERLTKVKNQGFYPLHAFKEFRTNHSYKIDSDQVAVNSFEFHPREIEAKLIGQMKEYQSVLEALDMSEVSVSYNPNVTLVTHHLAHAYSALMQAPFGDALIIVSDGKGSKPAHFSLDHIEWDLVQGIDSEATESMTAYELKSGELVPIKKIWNHKNSVNLNPGQIYEDASKKIFGDWSLAGKVMGLSAYGNSKTFTSNFSHAELAAQTQKKFEERSLEFFLDASSKAKSRKLILVGGCALNCIFNDKLLSEKIFDEIYIPPFPNDEGIALGSALALAAKNGDWSFSPVSYENQRYDLSSPGSDVDKFETSVPKLFNQYSVTKKNSVEVEAAKLLAEGNVIAWMQGRSEVGPRALGNRSILASPMIPDLKNYLNENIKFRENFRPYGGSILSEDAVKYLEVNELFQSPFMTFAPKVRAEFRETLKEIMHIDKTIRIQTVMKKHNSRYYSLIESFKSLTGIPLILNTSLNIMGQPILESLDDAKKFFAKSKIEIMVIGPYIIRKL